MSSETSLYYIPETGQITVNTLRVAGGNIANADYQDADGKPQHGLIGVLWLYFRDTPELDTAIDVYPGWQTEVGGYTVRVDGIEQDEEGSGIMVAVTPPG